MTMADGRRYWLMALGEESKHWDSCYAAGIAFIGWDDVAARGRSLFAERRCSGSLAISD